MSRTFWLFSTGLVLCTATAAQAQWAVFTNQTATRMPVGPGLNTAALSTTDAQEKDYAWADVDQDGDIDLVCVRKQQFTSSGRRAGVLFMNEGIAEGHSINGVLVDRTLQFASDTDAPAWDDPQIAGGSVPDQGLMTPTNNRDVLLVDINNDTWLDLITCTTISDDAPHHIGHPRIYINKGEVAGVWQGFKFEVGRIPAMLTASGVAGKQPRFCSVAAGDVTGDGYADLYYGDYDSSGAGGVAEPPGTDFNNKLLINQGASNPGWFTDTTNTRMSSNPGLLSAFGAASQMADMNNDGAIDVIKQTSLNAPLHVAIQHNDVNNIGFFPDNKYDIWNTNAPYFVSVGDLNNDGKLDMVVTDDNADRFHLATTQNADGTFNYGTATFSFQSGGDDGFGSQSIITDLNNDGWNDVLISDVDVDIGGCGRRLHIYRNLGNAPNVTLQEASPSIIPTTNLTGTFHTAVFDINNDGWKDIVIGRCNSTAVWMQTPPSGLAFSYPGGLPAYITPNQTTTIQVQLSLISGGTIAANSGKIFTSINNGAFVESAMTDLGGNLYETTLPALDCTDKVNFYFSGQLQGGNTFVDPPGAPASGTYISVAALGTEITLLDEIEGSVAEWTVTNGAGLTSGAWEPADPNGTINVGSFAAPEDDATAGSENVNAFVTQNGAPGGAANASDVDGGSAFLLSPTVDLTGTDATISYSRWFYRDNLGDVLATEVSNNNGASWVPVHTTTGTLDNGQTAWETVSFVVGDFVTPTSEVRVRFTASDTGTPSIIEAGIDNFRVDEVVCGDVGCYGDISPEGGDNEVNIDDLFEIIAQWGGSGGSADIAGGKGGTPDGTVNIDDLFAVIGVWGSCP